jgi:EAL domain-containing protein (putative c-di-GMP-specific phosphodiesterase class I)
VRYYEALARVRLADGELVAKADFLPAAAAGGLMPQIDNLMLFRCVQVARRLMGKNRDVGLFCNIAASTLVDAEIFPQFTEFLDANRVIAPLLFFEFTQAACRAFGPIENESLAALSGCGFRFAMDQVTDLKLEPRELADRGFRFVKAPAALLLNRHGARLGDIHAADLTGLLLRFELIADKIENEATVVDLLDYDVRYGQGYLFSQPRPLRAEILQAAPTPRAATAASATPTGLAVPGAGGCPGRHRQNRGGPCRTRGAIPRFRERPRRTRRRKACRFPRRAATPDRACTDRPNPRGGRRDGDGRRRGPRLQEPMTVLPDILVRSVGAGKSLFLVRSDIATRTPCPLGWTPCMNWTISLRRRP